MRNYPLYFILIVFLLDGRVAHAEYSLKEDFPMSHKGSIMFNKEELSGIYSMFYSSVNSDKEVEVVNKAEDYSSIINRENVHNDDRDLINKLITSPSFFLSAVMYSSPSDWALWLNNRKLMNNFNSEQLDVINVTEDRVAFAWKSTIPLDIISPEWKNNLAPEMPIKEVVAKKDGDKFTYIWDYFSEDRGIAIDSSKNAVRFVIKPKQSFMVSTLKIKEGFVPNIRFTIAISPQLSRRFDAPYDENNVIDNSIELKEEELFEQ